MANYYLNKNGTITSKPKSDKDKKKQQSQLEYNRQVSEKMKQQRQFKENVTKPIDYSTMSTKAIQKEKSNLQNQMNRYSGVTNDKGKYTLKGIIDAMSGKTRKKLEKDKTYKNAQDRLNELNSVLEQRFNESEKGKSKEMQIATALQNSVNNINTTRDELVTDPIQTTKTLGVGLGEGVQGSTSAIKSSLLDLANALSGGNLENTMWYQREKIGQMNQQIADPLKQTKTYKDIQEGKLGKGQQTAYNVGENIGAMIPAIATTAITGSPKAGSAVFYAQAQDNYYQEAKQRGYEEKQARMYSLAMAGVETIVERLGFDEIGGLPEGNIIKAMLGEGAEEFVTPYIDTVFRKYGFNEDVSWDDATKEAVEGALMGALTGGIMQLAGNGFAKVDVLVDKINNKEKISPTEIQEAVQEVQQADPNFMDNILSEAADNIDENTLNQIKQDMNIQEPSITEQENQTAPNTIEQQEKIEQPTQQVKIQEQQELNKKEQSIEKVSESKETEYENEYPNAQTVQKENGYTAYYSVPNEDINNKYGIKKADDITQQELNEGKIDLVTYNKDNTRNIYEFDNKKQLNKYIKSIGGYSALEGNYNIMSNTKEGEFYYVRDKSSQGGWIWKDANNDLVKGWQDKSRIKETRETMKKFYLPEKNEYGKLAKENGGNSEQIYLQERRQEDVLQLSTDKKSAKELTVMTSPPAKIQQKSNIQTPDGNDTIHYNPSQKITTQGEEAIYNYIQNKETSSEQKKVEITNKKLNKTIENRIKQLEEKGNFELAEIYKKKQEKGLYTVEHMGENLTKERGALEARLISGSDLETEYKTLMNDFNELTKSGELFKINEKTNNSDALLKWTERAYALYDTASEVALESDSSIYYDMVSNLDYMLDMEITHTPAQIMAMKSIEARKNPDNVPKYLKNKLVKEYIKEKKYHAFDQTWIKENNPYDATNNSPYRMTGEERNTLTKLTAELNKIDKTENRFEYQKKLYELDDYSSEIMVRRYKGIRKAVKTLYHSVISLIKQHNLMSVHVGFFNGASNVVDSTFINPAERIAYNKYQKKLSKKTGIITSKYTLQGRSIYYKGAMEGIKNVGTEFIKGVQISDMNTKFTINNETDFSDIGNLQPYKIRAKTKVGKVLTAPINFGGRVVRAWMGIGDTPKSTATRNEMLFNELNQEAIRQSIDSGKDSVFYRQENKKAGNVKYYLTDSEGNFYTKTVSNKQSEEFLNNKNQIEATDYMLEIAHDAGEEATYSQKADNYFSNIGNNGKKFLDSILPGWGETTAQFFNVTSNIAVEIYKHSPLAYGELKKGTKTLEKNIELRDKLIDDYIAEGKDFTKTAEYRDMQIDNYKLQNKMSKLYGKIIAGSLLETAGLTLAALGLARGDIDKEDEEKGVLKNSIKIGNKYISFDFGLFGSLLKTGIIEKEADEKDNFLDNTASLFKGYMSLMIEQSVISNFRDMFSSTYGIDWDEIISNTIVNDVSSLTTPGFVKEISLMLDDYTSRSTYSNDKWEYLVNRLKANWNRKDLPKKYDGWGNTMKKGSNLIDSAWNTFFKNDFISTAKENKVDMELADVYQMTGNHEVLPLKSNGAYKNSVNKFSYNKTEYNLDDKEKEKFSETYGKSAYENMKKLINSSIYKSADYETKVKYIKEIYENARDVAKSEVLDNRGIKYYNTGQKILILGENNRFEHLPIIEALDSNLSYTSAREKIESPQVYKYATTIVKDYDIYKAAQTESSEIEKMYSETNDRKNAYIEYVNSCSKLSKLEKAMLIKTKYSSLYKKYDEDIKQYLQSQHLSDEEYQYALKQMGLDKKKKNK